MAVSYTLYPSRRVRDVAAMHRTRIGDLRAVQWMDFNMSIRGDSFTLALDVNCALGESPVWVPERGLLIFVDISGRKLYRYDTEANQVEHVSVDEDIGCVAVARGGGYVAGMRSGVWLLNESGTKRRKLVNNPEDQASSRFNDGRVDPAGRYLTGTLDESKKVGNAGLYRCDSRGLVRLDKGFMTSNGLAFSPDGRTLYFSDTPRFVIYQFDYDPASGEASNRREFARIEPTATDRGRPVIAIWAASHLMSSHPVMQ